MWQLGTHLDKCLFRVRTSAITQPPGSGVLPIFVCSLRSSDQISREIMSCWQTNGTPPPHPQQKKKSCLINIEAQITANVKHYNNHYRERGSWNILPPVMLGILGNTEILCCVTEMYCCIEIFCYRHILGWYGNVTQWYWNALQHY